MSCLKLKVFTVFKRNLPSLFEKKNKAFHLIAPRNIKGLSKQTEITTLLIPDDGWNVIDWSLYRRNFINQAMESRTNRIKPALGFVALLSNLCDKNKFNKGVFYYLVEKSRLPLRLVRLTIFKVPFLIPGS